MNFSLTRCLILPIFLSPFVAAKDPPEPPPLPSFHLTAHPWSPLQISRDQYLDAIEGICRFTIQHQDAKGDRKSVV